MKRILSRAGRLAACSIVLGSVVAGHVTAARADAITYFGGGNFTSLTGTLQGLGYNTADPGIESANQLFAVPGQAGSTTRLDFTFMQDFGGYQFSFGFFDRSAVSADPIAQRAVWGAQALAAATEVFDNRTVSIGDTASFDVAAGTQLGWFLIPNDTLAAVLSDPAAFYAGNRPEPLFSVSEANPGSFDQLLTFEAGGLTTLAFEDLTRAGSSDMDFNDMVVTLRTSVISETSIEVVNQVSEPSVGAVIALGALSLFAARRRFSMSRSS
ncbi:MAG: DUF4114 domain-containing protein [Rhodospirillaceae bacterium]